MPPPIEIAPRPLQRSLEPQLAPMRDGSRSGKDTLPPSGLRTGGSRGRRSRKVASTASLRDDASIQSTPSAMSSGSKPSLLSRLGPKVDDATLPEPAALNSVPKLVVDPSSPRSPSTPKGRSIAAGLPAKPSLSIRGAAEETSSNAPKSTRPSALSVSTSSTGPALPRKPAIPISKQRLPGSAPPERINFPAAVQERPASALAAATANQPALRESSPTPRLSWADDTEDDSLPDLDDWNIGPSQETKSVATEKLDDDTEASDAASPKEQSLANDGEQTPVGEARTHPGPPRERRKRGAGKKNKKAALENSSSHQETVTENPVSIETSAPRKRDGDQHPSNDQRPAANGRAEHKSDPDDAPSLVASLSGLSVTSVEHRSTPATPKVASHSITSEHAAASVSRVPDAPATSGAAQLMEALVASIATMKAATTARSQSGGISQSIHSAPRPNGSERGKTPNASPPKAAGAGLTQSIHAAPAVNHEVPNGLHTSAGVGTRPYGRTSHSQIPLSRKAAPTFFADQVPPHSSHIGSSPSSTPSTSNATGTNDSESPMTLPTRKQARPVITADAITRLARGLNRDREAHH